MPLYSRINKCIELRFLDCVNSTMVLQIILLNIVFTNASYTKQNNVLLHSLEVTLKRGKTPLCFSLYISRYIHIHKA